VHTLIWFASKGGLAHDSTHTTLEEKAIQKKVQQAYKPYLKLSRQGLKRYLASRPDSGPSSGNQQIKENHMEEIMQLKASTQNAWMIQRALSIMEKK